MPRQGRHKKLWEKKASGQDVKTGGTKEMEKLNLQRFADEAENAQAPDQGKPAEEPKGDSAKYTDADLDRIISAKFAKWAADRDKAVDDARKEGEKLAKMNADQKRAYELEQAQKEAQSLKEQVAKLEQAQKQAELRKSAAEIFWLYEKYLWDPLSQCLPVENKKDLP